MWAVACEIKKGNIVTCIFDETIVGFSNLSYIFISILTLDIQAENSGTYKMIFFFKRTFSFVAHDYLIELIKVLRIRESRRFLVECKYEPDQTARSEQQDGKFLIGLQLSFVQLSLDNFV